MWFINILGLALIALIVWWFWLVKPRQASITQEELIVTVDNGVYSPSQITVPPNTQTALKFLRKDASPCAESVIFPDLEISESLPLDKVKILTLPPLKAGVYPFHCQMVMYKGDLRVEG